MSFECFANYKPQPIGVKRNFGLVVPLVHLEGQWHIVFEERAHTLRSQPGEICLPGGAVEALESPQEAALREAQEELGIGPQAIRLMGPLDYMITPFNYALYPYLVQLKITNLSELKPNPDEVERLFSVPLSFFLTHEPEKHTLITTFATSSHFPFDKIQNGESYNWKQGSYDILFYDYQGDIIWGMTAKIIDAFVQSLQKSKLATSFI